MTWLLAHMWIVLAAASLVAVLLGWSVRGMMMSGKLRQAIVERDMTRVELGNSREEVEKLFAQIKKLSSGEAPAPPPPDPILARKVDALTAELARKSAEIEALKSGSVQTLTSAPGGAATGPGPADETLIWRNRHLESRVVHLEAELAKAAKAAPAPAAAAAPAAATNSAKLDWEVKYLRTRVDALQTELSTVPPPVAVMAAASAAPAVAPTPEVAAPVEEEIARLRWRVRFLEGRLAYFEGDAGPGAAEASPDAEPPKPARVSEAILGQLEAADERADADAAQQVARIRPVALEKPVDGKADDLTLIGGIGPKIQDVLNSLGIFHFDQIADWTPENIAWVDEYLSFAGRITREGWIEQAAVLVGEAADA